MKLNKVDDKTAYGNLLVKYAELESKIDDIKANCDLAIEGKDTKIKELEGENNKLLDVINNQDVKIADLEKQITALEAKNIELSENWRADHDTLVFYNEKLEKENAELKAKNKWYSEQVCNKECAEVWGNLTKATDLLKEVQGYIENIDNEGDELYDKIEQFLKCENIILEDAQAGNSPFDADEVFNKEMKAYPKEK